VLYHFRMIDKDFLKRVNSSEFQSIVDEHQHLSREKRLAYVKLIDKSVLRRHQRKYENTEKGKLACERRNTKRKKTMISERAEITDQEKHLIRQFYIFCEKGYEVDHVIPLSKGGKHRLSNLQYLTISENRFKASKLDYLKKTT